MTKKPLRDSMPTVAAWIDELRDAFGADGINAAIRAGLRGADSFYAEEAGQQIGNPAMPGSVSLGADQLVLQPAEKREGRA